VKISIQVMSDSALFRQVLRYTLEQSNQIDVMEELACKDDCFRYCYSDKVDVLIINLSDGLYSSLECLHQIIVRQPHAKVVVIISKYHTTLIQTILKYGAKGVVSHNASISQLMDAITRVHARGTYIEAALAQTIAESPLSTSSPFETLTLREASVLRILLNGKSNPEVAVMLNISEKTVANHYSHIKKKLGVQNRVELTRLSIQHKIIQANCL